MNRACRRKNSNCAQERVWSRLTDIVTKKRNCLRKEVILKIAQIAMGVN